MIAMTARKPPPEHPWPAAIRPVASGKQQCYRKSRAKTLVSVKIVTGPMMVLTPLAGSRSGAPRSPSRRRIRPRRGAMSRVRSRAVRRGAFGGLTLYDSPLGTWRGRASINGGPHAIRARRPGLRFWSASSPASAARQRPDRGTLSDWDGRHAVTAVANSSTVRTTIW
jgi:hypothetical protein